MERIILAAGETGLDQLVETLPMAWDTVLASGDVNFSGGQRQLILVTACIASERRILLLDEPMASLDWCRRVALGRFELLRAKTIIYASHDGSPLV